MIYFLEVLSSKSSSNTLRKEANIRQQQVNHIEKQQVASESEYDIVKQYISVSRDA